MTESALDFPTFMTGLIKASEMSYMDRISEYSSSGYVITDCVKCLGLGAAAIYCCDGRECGCHGMPVDFIDCDCGAEFPSDEQIKKWSEKND